MDETELKNIIEAALLAAGQPVTLDRLLALFPETQRPTRDEVRAALARLEEEYRGRGIELKEIDRGYRIQTHARYAEWISRLSEERPVRYSRALLETLAIIAYRQPVTRADIEDIRGVAVGTETIKTLLARNWIRQVGQKEVPGRPALYGTSRGFLEYFNLGSLDELPSLAKARATEFVAADLASAGGGHDPRTDTDTEADADTDTEAGAIPGQTPAGAVPVEDPGAPASDQGAPDASP